MTSRFRLWLAVLYTAVALLHLLPIWRVHYVPTLDGPSHLYNATVLRELAAGTPEFTRVFAADLRPHPNWLGHLLMWVLLYVVAPLVAEKLLLTAIVLLFLGGCWRLAGAVDERSRVYAFLAMPLTFHLLLQLGFYNYSLGCALVPFAVTAWWKRSRAMSAIWFVLCYFAHAIAAGIALLMCGVLWVASLRREGRKELIRVVEFLPATLLLVWFMNQPARPGGTWQWDGAFLLAPLARAGLIFIFDARQLMFGTILGIVFGLLIIATVFIENVDRTRRRVIVTQRDLFLLMTLIAVALFVAAPLSVEEGFVLKARLYLFPYLFLLPWLTPRLARMSLAIVFALAAAANVFFIRDYWKRNDRIFERAVAPLTAVEPLQTIVPLVFDKSTPHSYFTLLGHAASYGAVQRRLVNLGNYEAGMGFFPVAFDKNLRRPTIFEIEAAPGNFDVATWAHLVDLIYTWKMPPGAPIEARLAEHYDLIADQGDGRVYRRRSTP